MPTDSPAIADNEDAIAAERAAFVRDRLPKNGLFAGHEWRIAPRPLQLDKPLVRQLEFLGRVLLQFYRSVNLLHRQSTEGRQPEWIADWLDRGKPASLLEAQRDTAFKNEIPRVIRPDVLLTDDGLFLAELDSIPGGIGLTAWLNQVYSQAGARVIGGERGMIDGFAGIFGDAKKVEIKISEEAATYRPEMEWLAEQAGADRFSVSDAATGVAEESEAVYRFFELFDLPNLPAAEKLFAQARGGRLQLTPPPKPVFEEKMLFALLWNRNLREFWRRELGGRFFQNLQEIVPYTWIVDPAPLPPLAAFPEIGLTDWQQLKSLSQKERQLILKVSGFSEEAWGSRGVFLGSDLSAEDWSVAVDRAMRSAHSSPFILQRFHKPKSFATSWYDFEASGRRTMNARTRLCPYYFVEGEGDRARAHLRGVLATLCPADKKIIHGMSEAILLPCATGA